MKLIYSLALALILGQVAHSLTIKATIRDFLYSHPDFEGLASYANGPGYVETQLGADRKPVYKGNAPSITSFADWFNDVPGVNMKTTYDLELIDPDGDGVYTYSNQAYFPIDNQLFGNENGAAHNFGFTTEVHTTFTYQLGQKFTCTGDDDIWVFINDQLVIDLGGPHGPLSRTVDLGTLGLTAGNTYTLDIFQAERQSPGSTFAMETSLVLVTDPCPKRTAAKLALCRSL